MAVSVPSFAAPPADTATAGPSVNAGILGLQDPELDDLKQAAISVIQQGQGRAKRPKLTHSLFFKDEQGLNKIVKTFPKIRFQGKGREFDDLKILIRHYEKWFKELFPCDEHFEDLVWRARSVLQEKEKAEDGTISDPREELHRVRFQYKVTSGIGTKGEQAKLEAAAVQKKGMSTNISEELRKRMEGNRNLDMDTLWKIEEKRAKALEIRRKRQEESAARGGPQGSQTQSSRASQEDIFGFGGGLDGSQTSGGSQRPQAGHARATPQTQSSRASQEDVFGYGFGMDGSQSSPATQQGKAALTGRMRRALSQASQGSRASEEDVFGFGVGFDGSQVSSAASQARGAPALGGTQVQTSQDAVGDGRQEAAVIMGERTAVDLSEELRRKIEANRQRALEVQRKKREKEVQEVHDDAPKDIPVDMLWKIEENRARALELRRKKQAARQGSLSQTQSSRASQEDASQASGATQQTQPTQLQQARERSEVQASAASQADILASQASQSQVATALSIHQATSQHEQMQSAAGAGIAPSQQLLSQPDVFGFGFGFEDASQAVPSQRPPSTTRQEAKAFMPPPPQSQMIADPVMAMSQPDVFGFGFDFDSSQVAPPVLSTGPVPADATGICDSTSAMSLLPSTAAPDPLPAISQPDIFGFGFGLDESQAEPVVAAASQPLETNASRRGGLMPPPPTPVHALDSSAVPSQPGLPIGGGQHLEAANSNPFSTEAFMDMSQPDVFGFSCEFDASQAVAAAPSSSTAGSQGGAGVGDMDPGGSIAKQDPR